MLVSGKLSQVYKDMLDRILKLEAEKYDVNYSVRQKDFEVRLALSYLSLIII